MYKVTITRIINEFNKPKISENQEVNLTYLIPVRELKEGLKTESERSNNAITYAVNDYMANFSEWLIESIKVENISPKATPKEEALLRLDTIKQDCESQVNALEQRQDVSWDCYSLGNWSSMLNNINKIMELLEC